MSSGSKRAFGSKRNGVGSSGHDDGHGGLMITPLLDLFVVLIPFLILSVVLTKINVVDVAVSKPVAVVKKKQTNFDLRLDVGKTNAVIKLNGRRVKNIKVAEGWTQELHDELVKIKRKHVDEYRIKIQPNSNAALEDLMMIMDMARNMSPNDEPIIKEGEDKKPVQVKYLFPNVVLRGVYN
jgi:biopolymer transport protein ExbD